LAGAACGYADNIGNLAALGWAVELIAQQHGVMGIQAEHYPVIGRHLLAAVLAAVKEILGDAATDDYATAWSETDGALAETFVDREAEIYAEQIATPGD
jgi:nitric oxide dioxygenase